MSYIKIHQEKISDREKVKALCPFGAIEENAAGELEIGAGCRMCRLCIRKGEGAFEFIDESASQIDKTKWRGVAVVAEVDSEGALHPVGLELLGKARELAKKIDHPVQAVVIGSKTTDASNELLEHGADEVYVYEDKAFEHFRIDRRADGFGKCPCLQTDRG